jgi:hypothetical protein
MANVRGTPRYGVIRPMARTPVVEEIVPNSGWTEDSTGHYLLVDLPGIYCFNITNFLKENNYNIHMIN